MDCCRTEYNCPVGATLELIGGKYKSLILWHLIDATLRFGELRRLIPQATPKMLTQQLRELEEANLVIRTVYPVVPPKVEYKTSDFGRSIKPVLEAMYAWGADYLQKSGKEISCSMAARA
ncbi:MAG: helix-turn-helix transcriptional regulator [Oscillospiraceae bacterium]|nr:helix-turn-helix transcriptional regulator [Oscillospiraceae bacterium]